jgi:hypothetical protein
LREQCAEGFLIKPSELETVGPKALRSNYLKETLAGRQVTHAGVADVEREASLQGNFEDFATGRTVRERPSLLDFFTAIRNGGFFNELLGQETRNDLGPLFSEESKDNENRVTLPEFLTQLAGVLQNRIPPLDFLKTFQIRSEIIEAATEKKSGGRRRTKRRMLRNRGALKDTIAELNSIVLPARDFGDESSGSHSLLPNAKKDSTAKKVRSWLGKSDERDSVHTDPSVAGKADGKILRSTMIVKEFSVPKGRLRGSRRCVVHEITQSQPKPFIILVSNAENVKSEVPPTIFSERKNDFPSAERKSSARTPPLAKLLSNTAEGTNAIRTRPSANYREFATSSSVEKEASRQGVSSSSRRPIMKRVSLATNPYISAALGKYRQIMDMVFRYRRFRHDNDTSGSRVILDFSNGNI